MNTNDSRPIFLSGATGFVGSHLYPKLVEAGYDVRCGTRSPEKAQKEHPHRQWVAFDVHDPATVVRALRGCRAAFYLVHEMAAGGDYRKREQEAALGFREAAGELGVERVVYLGGVAPAGVPSEHLSSRLQTGRILRGGTASTIELRASMIIGPGSASWQVVRDLAARLPLMLLPAWTRSRTEPIYLDDVLVALMGALELERGDSRSFDIPGPDKLTVEEMLLQTAELLGNQPRRLYVPVLSPKLSSYWLRFVTGTNWHIARELVEGLTSDLVARDDAFWDLIDHRQRVSFDEAARRTLWAQGDDVKKPRSEGSSGEESAHLQ